MRFTGESRAVCPDGTIIGELTHANEDILSVKLDSDEIIRSQRVYSYLDERRIYLAEEPRIIHQPESCWQIPEAPGH